MERVAFLIERTGRRLGCLLNPSSLLVRRVAGVRRRQAATGGVTGSGLSDDPLIMTGGGMTELKLDLLFDVTIPGSSVATEDVRDLTAPIWKLAENQTDEGGYGRPPIVRFIWGKSWNIPGVVTAAAERLEYFTPEGVPRRSWLRMRMIRVAEPEPPQAPPPVTIEELPKPESIQAFAEAASSQEVAGGAAPEDGGSASAGERLDQLAYKAYGNSAYWRVLALFNNILDPLKPPEGLVVKIPLLSRIKQWIP